MRKIFTSVLYWPCFFLLLSFFSGNLSAIIKFEDAIFPELITGGRPLAMGNAYLCKADDSAAVFYNPAGLGTVRWTHLHFSNLHLETNKGLLQASSGGSLKDSGSDSTKGFNTEGTRQILLKNRGSLVHNRINFMPNFTTRYFSLGYFYSKQSRATIAKKDDAKFEFSIREDQGPYAALNISLFGGVFKLGVSGAVLKRNEILDERDRTKSVGEIKSSEYNKGTMTFITAGSRITFPWTFLPTLALTIHNFSDSEFAENGGAGKPAQIKRTVDFGFSITPQVGKVMRVHFEFNYKDLQKSYDDTAAARRIQLGMEIDFQRTFFVRAGYGDGFGSAGIGLRARTVEFDLTTYAVKPSTANFNQEEDRRFAMTLSSGI